MSKEQETHAAVVKLARNELEQHERINCWFRPEFVRALIDRLEAAHKREMATAEKSSAVGNGAKMREALEFLIKHKEWLRGYNLTMTLEDLEVIDRILGKAEAALAEPRRNCDVKREAEKIRRYLDFCATRNCVSCPARTDSTKCQINWKRMTCEPKEGGEG